jgi:uncharacterized membrane protein
MQIDAMAAIAILGMALVTYATRMGGVWLLGRVRSSLQIEAGLRYVLGAVLTAIVVPAVIQAGFVGLLAAAATVVAVRRTGNLLLALALGVACVWVLRIVFERAMEVVLMIARIWRGLTPAEQADAYLAFLKQRAPSSMHPSRATEECEYCPV